jgi:alpha-amylase
MNAIAFPFLADGIPIMYSGGEQEYEGGKSSDLALRNAGPEEGLGDDPFNREPMWQAKWSSKDNLYMFISRVIAARNTA